jgi:uncharacterized protein (DUF305 family)
MKCPQEIDMQLRLAVIAATLIGLPFAVHAQDGPAQRALMSADMKMMDEMHKPMSGDADKDFVMMMLPHHRGAVDMAQVELQYGKDKKLRALAKKIIKAQEKEIAFMEAWQAAHK